MKSAIHFLENINARQVRFVEIPPTHLFKVGWGDLEPLNQKIMQHIRKLLQIETSDLARVLRYSLQGLQATLGAARADFADDAGTQVCEELLQELDLLLEVKPEEPTPKPPSERGLDKFGDGLDIKQSITQEKNREAVFPASIFEPVAEEEDSQKDSSPFIAASSSLLLSELREIFLGDSELSEYLGELELTSNDDSQLWNEMQRLLLRLPDTLARSWQEQIEAKILAVGASPDSSAALAIPFSRDEPIYPGLTGSVLASGLRFSSEISLDARVADGQLKGDRYFLAGVVSACLKFIELDPSLHHAFKVVYAFGLQSLASEAERSKYIDALIDRFRRAQKAEQNGDSVAALRGRLDLDEAIHSLVYPIPGDRYSWWGKLQQESRRTLDSAANWAREEGHKVHIRSLWGPYADVLDYSKDDLELDRGGIRGEVLACLRVYAKIDEQVFPGRVLFRS